MDGKKDRIVVIGNVGIEHIFGVDGFPSRNETVLSRHSFWQVGGAGAIISSSISLLGKKVSLISVVGRDRSLEIIDTIKSFGVDDSNIRIDNLLDSATKFTLVDDNGNSISILTKSLLDGLSKSDVKKAERSIRKAKVLVLELGIPKDIIKLLLDIAKEEKIFTVIIPTYTSQIERDIISSADLIVFNESEASYITTLPVRHIETATLAIKRLSESYNMKNIVLLFSKGDVLYKLDNGDNNIKHLPSLDIRIVDKSVYELAFVGGLSVKLYDGESIDEAIKFGQKVCAYTLQKVGGLSSLPTKEDIEEFDGAKKTIEVDGSILDYDEEQRLKGIARKIRRDILSMVSSAGSGHPGGSLSVVEILTLLYFNEMRIDPKNPDWELRDRLVLSKGHSAPALYAVLAEKGFFPKEELWRLRKLGSILQGHPDMKRTPGIDFSTGSLGQGLSVANGIALGMRLRGIDRYVYVILGDGEMQEGEIWEASMTAVHYKLDNLIAILDYNGLQIGGTLGEVKSTIEPVAEKWLAFGWHVEEINGHDFYEIKMAINKAKKIKGKPSIIIAYTIKGKGVSFMERIVDYHGKVPKREDIDKALQELEQAAN